MGDATEKKKGGKGKIIAIIVVVLVVIAIAGGVGGNSSGSSSSTSSSSTQTTTTASNDSSVSVEYQNALKKAQTYSDVMYMSKQGIYDQLVSEYGEKFTAEEAQYAIDNLPA